jgi:hypothetical protein
VDASSADTRAYVADAPPRRKPCVIAAGLTVRRACAPPPRPPGRDARLTHASCAVRRDPAVSGRNNVIILYTAKHITYRILKFIRGSVVDGVWDAY